VEDGAVRLVVGLGNPGRRYRATRHNVGFRVVERLAERHRNALGEARFEGRFGRGRIGGDEVAILEPLGWMNASGAGVAEAVASLPVEDPARDLLVVFDDADLPFGRLRLRPGGSDGGHRGLRDVLAILGRLDVPRLRFGIGRPQQERDTAQPRPKRGTVDWVLAPFSAEEERDLPALLDRAAHAIETFLAEGVAAAMNRFNALAAG
jgi:PTH1 family peptidyl-tRNA hydrolase